MSDEPGFGERVLLYLYGMPNIAGCVLAFGGLALFFGGVIDRWWWAIVVGLYLAGTLGWPRDSLAEAAQRTELSLENLVQQLERLVTKVAKGLPNEAIAALHGIEATLRELLPRLKEMQERGALSAEAAFTVTETVRRYLPDTLAGYLKLPRVYAHVQRLPDGKTASQTLVTQLELLNTSLQQIARNAFADDAEKLLANGRFLQDKFAEKTAFRA